MNVKLRVSFLACVLGVAVVCGQEFVSGGASGLGSSGSFVKGEGPLRNRRSPLTSGVPVGLTIPVVEGPSIWIADQFTIVVPDGSSSLWIELAPDDQADDFVFFLRYNQAVELTDGQVIADFGSLTGGWYEELGIWGSVAQPGTYYIAIATFTLDGGTLTLTATVDGGVYDLVPGTAVECRVPSDDAAAGDGTVTPDGQQFHIAVPADAEALYLRFQSSDLAADTLCAFRYGVPCEASTTGGLEFDFYMDFAGGFEEASLITGDGSLQPGQDLYIWIWNDSGTGAVLEGTLLVEIGAPEASIALGEMVTSVARAVKDQATAVLGARQYTVTVTEPLSELRISVAPTEVPADLDLYVRKDSPVVIQDGQFMADFSAVTAGSASEEIVIPCDAVTAAKYYIAVAATSTEPAPYALIVEAGTSCSAAPISLLVGNVNTDNKVDIADAITLLGYLFARKTPPTCAKAADANDDDTLNIADAITILGYLFSGKPMYAPDHAEIRPANNVCTPYAADGKDGADKPYFPVKIGDLEPCATPCVP